MVRYPGGPLSSCPEGRTHPAIGTQADTGRHTIAFAPHKLAHAADAGHTHTAFVGGHRSERKVRRSGTGRPPTGQRLGLVARLNGTFRSCVVRGLR